MRKRIVLGQREVLVPWLKQRAQATFDPTDCETIGLVDEDTRTILAVAAYENYTGVNGSVQVHLAGDGKRWMNRDFLWVGFDYPFNVLKVKKLLGQVPSWNTAALRLNAHFGYKTEHVIEGYYPNGNLVIVSMVKEDCRWLRIKEKPDGEEGT